MYRSGRPSSRCDRDFAFRLSLHTILQYTAMLRTSVFRSFASWVDFVQEKSYNPNTKVYLGLPAAPDTNVVYDLEMYLQPYEANEIISALQCEYKHEFGGVMMYEATFSQNNQVNGQPYAVSPFMK